MTWKYQIFNFGTHCGLCEAYYDEEGNLTGLTEEILSGESKEDILKDLVLMVDDIQKQDAVLSYDELRSELDKKYKQIQINEE